MSTDKEIKANLRKFYDQDAQRRIEKPNTEEWKIAHRAAFLKRCKEASAGRILEVGSGIGRDSLFLKQEGQHAFPIDLSVEMVTHCRSKGLPACRMDSYHLAYKDNTFDAVWSLNTLLRVPKANIKGVWQEIRRVMKPGAIFFLGVYGGPDSEGVWEEDWDQPPRFFSFFTDDEILVRIQEVFHLLSFDPTDISRPKHHFQALTLQKI